MDTLKKSIFIIGCICITILICSCGKYYKPTETSSEASTVILAAGRHLAPGEKDGYYCSKILQVWEPLITDNELTGRPQSCLATSWEMRDNGKVWLFTLQKGVRFQDGTSFNADAVLKNFDRMKKGIKTSNFYLLNIDSFYPGLEKYEKFDDYTICLTFKQPNATQPYNMMNYGSAIYSPACFDDDGNFNGPAVGTGPFKITENNMNKYVKLERNDDYYGIPAKTKKIVVKNIPNAEVRYSALKSGEIMGVMDLDAITPVLAEELKKDNRFAVSVSKSMIIRFLLVNGTKFPFNDPRMRRAVSLAINRTALVQTLYAGYASPTVNILNYTSSYYKKIPVAYDLEKAKHLAAEVLQGKKYTMVYCINGADVTQKGEAELIAFWLSEIGLDIKIQSMEYSSMLSALRHGRYDLARSQQGMPNGDPYFIFHSFMMPQGNRNVSDHIGFYDEAASRYMQEVKYCVDEKKRKEIFDHLQDISVEQQPVIPLFNDVTIVAYDRRLHGYDAKPYGITLSAIEMDE